MYVSDSETGNCKANFLLQPRDFCGVGVLHCTGDSEENVFLSKEVLKFSGTPLYLPSLQQSSMS